jgi:hypothetical protein
LPFAAAATAGVMTLLHTPASQYWPSPQGLRQEPQLSASVRKLTHWFLQTWYPAGHGSSSIGQNRMTPESQTWLMPQRLLQSPQLLRS